MTDIPTLSTGDIEEQLDKLCASKRSHHLFAFFGEGVEESLSLTRWGSFQVVPVRSELELRDRMPPLEDDDARIAFLVPWTSDVPLDLAGRFALGGRVQRVGPEARLKRIFAVADIDADARNSALATYLLRPGRQRSYSVANGGKLTLSSMWGAWLKTEWGVEVEGGWALDTLIAWAAQDGRGQKWLETMSATDAQGVRAAFLSFLTGQLDQAGAAVWTAWETGRGRTALELSLLFETLATDQHAGVRMWARQAARAAFGIESSEQADRVVEVLGRAAGGAIRHLQRRAGPSEVRGLLNSADARVDEPEVRSALASSSRLPSGWRSRLENLGRSLAICAHQPGVASVATATEAFHAVELHSLSGEQDTRQIARRAEMAVRLAAWLAHVRGRPVESGMTSFSDVEKLGRWYAEEGGFVDWARRWARGPAGDEFGKGVEAVVAAADAERTKLDHRFARALRGWVDAGRPSNLVLPIDKAVDRVAARFLNENSDRRLLILLLDGMAWAQAAELLVSLGERSVPWGPLAWHSSRTGKIGEGRYPVVLAGLPTVTEVSRAAFFAGKATKAGEPGSTEKDVERWQQNKIIAAFSPPPDVPRLLLRSEGHTPDGMASEEAMSLVGDRTRRVVALVINAIDASLKGDPQAWHPWKEENIRSLSDLLERARETGRAVLIASDHGHVPADRFEPAGAFEKAGARWRPLWSANEVVRDFEVAFDAGAAVWAPRGAVGVALLADDEHRYGGGAHAGEHGGATLAEVVAPCVLIGCDDGLAPAEDKGVVVGPAYVPAWWHYEVHEQLVRATQPIPESPKQKPEKQLSLIAEQARTPPAAAQPAPRSSPLATSKLLEARAPRADLRRQVVLAVVFLDERGGSAQESAFATAMNILSFRVGGFIALLQEVLNVDGYEILSHDRAGKQVVLDRAKLEQQFEIKL